MKKFIINVLSIFMCATYVACGDINGGLGDSGLGDAEQNDSIKNDSLQDKPELNDELRFSKISGLDMVLLDSIGYTTGLFTVDSPKSYKVSCDEIWINFSTEIDGEYFPDIEGENGCDTVYVKVTDEIRAFEETKGVVKLIVDEKESIVDTIVRPGKGYEFEVVTDSSEVVKKINIGHDATSWIAFRANFECAIVEFPEWIEEPVYENEGYRLNVVEDSLPVARSGKVVVSDYNSLIKYELPVEYIGMDPRTITIQNEQNPWNWLVSLDGKTLEQKSSSMDEGAESVVLQNGYAVMPTCLNYECKFFCVEEDSEGKLLLMEGDEAWINSQLKEGTVNEYILSVAPFNISSTKMLRTGYLFALPVALCEEFREKITAGENVVDLYESNVVIHATQSDENGTVGCIISNGEGNVVNSTLIPAEEEFYQYFASEFFASDKPGEDISICEIVPGMSYDINTKMTRSGGKKNIEICELDITYNETGQMTKIVRNTLGKTSDVEDKSGWNMNIALDEDGFYHFTFTVPATQEKMISLRMFRASNINVKALIMNVKQ